MIMNYTQRDFFRVVAQPPQSWGLVNPRRACAARVTVVGSVCLSVCVSVTFDLPSRMSNRAINRRAYLAAYKRQKFRGDSPETTAFRSYGVKHERKSQYANLSAYPRSAFTARCRPRRRGLSSDDQEPPALSQTVPTDAASRVAPPTGSLQRVYGLPLRYKRTRKRTTTRGVANFRACVLVYARRPPGGCTVRYAPRVCTLVLFIVELFVLSHVLGLCKLFCPCQFQYVLTVSS